MPIDKKFIEFIKKEMKSENVREDKLAIIYRCLGVDEKSRKMFQYLTTFGAYQSKLDGLPEKYIDDREFRLTSVIDQNI